MQHFMEIKIWENLHLYSTRKFRADSNRFLFTTPIVFLGSFLELYSNFHMRARMFTNVLTAPCACMYVSVHVCGVLRMSPLCSLYHAHMPMFKPGCISSHARAHICRDLRTRTELYACSPMCRNLHSQYKLPMFVSSAPSANGYMQMLEKGYGAVGMRIHQRTCALLHVQANISVYKHSYLTFLLVGGGSIFKKC